MEYKVLMVGIFFINEMMLNRGIYYTQNPALHDMDYTKSNLLRAWSNYAAISGEPMANIEENLSKCELKTVTITIK